MQLADTTSEARRAQLNAYRSMAPAERVAIALSLSEDARNVLLDGIVRREPHLRPVELHARLHGVFRRRPAT